MAISLTHAPSGAVALVFDPADLDALRGAINDLYGAIRRPWVSRQGADIGFGDEDFLFEDEGEPLKMISLSPNGAVMLRALAARLEAAR